MPMENNTISDERILPIVSRMRELVREMKLLGVDTEQIGKLIFPIGESVPTVKLFDGGIIIPDEGNAVISLNPSECALYELFLRHPEGISSDGFVLCREEYYAIYRTRSNFDEDVFIRNTVDSLCAESKTVFYSTVSRIKHKIVSALGAWESSPYLIERGRDGLYRIKAILDP